MYHDRDEDCMPEEVLEEKRLMLEHCEKWSLRLNECEAITMESAHSGLDKAGWFNRNIALRTLRMQYEASLMLVSSKAPVQPEVFGAVPNIAARNVIQLCARIMGNTPSNDATGHHPPPTIFSLETGPVSVLFLLAIKCGDQHVVRKAVELLERHQRRESLYDSRTVVRMIRRLEDLKAQRKSEMTEIELLDCPNESLEYWCGHLIDSGAEDLDGQGVDAAPSGCSTDDDFTSTYAQLMSVLRI
jgi:hypothetical protein